MLTNAVSIFYYLHAKQQPIFCYLHAKQQPNFYYLHAKQQPIFLGICMQSNNQTSPPSPAVIAEYADKQLRVYAHAAFPKK